MKKPEYWQESIDYLSNVDTKLGELINKYSQSTLTTRGDALETLMRSIVGQQISFLNWLLFQLLLQLYYKFHSPP